MKTILIVSLVLSLVTAPVAAQTAAPSTADDSSSAAMFADVPKGHWAYEAIEKLTRDGVMIGYFDKPANTFRGDRTLTRYEFAYALRHAMLRIEENIRRDQRSEEIEAFLRRQNADPKTLEIFTMLMQEFKAELNDMNLRITRLEEKTRHATSAAARLPLYFSLAAVLLSLVSLTVSLQK